MPIILPRIEGTKFDALLNGFIASVNRETHAEQPKLAAHAVAATIKFLAVHHETAAGIPWTQQALPLVRHVAVIPSMVDKLYDQLEARSKGPSAAGCVAVLIVLALVAGICWWWFSK